jgi:hypothetical protein
VRVEKPGRIVSNPPSILDDVIRECYGNKPQTISRLLRALAGTEDARRQKHDTILIGAAEMIEAFERKTK